MRKIILLNANQEFLNSISTRLVADETELDVISLNNVSNLVSAVNKINPDLIAVAANIIEDLDDWDFGNIPVVTYYNRKDEKSILDEFNLPTYGIIKNQKHMINVLQGEIPSKSQGNQNRQKPNNDRKYDNKEPEIPDYFEDENEDEYIPRSRERERDYPENRNRNNRDYDDREEEHSNRERRDYGRDREDSSYRERRSDERNRHDNSYERNQRYADDKDYEDDRYDGRKNDNRSRSNHRDDENHYRRERYSEREEKNERDSNRMRDDRDYDDRYSRNSYGQSDNDDRRDRRPRDYDDYDERDRGRYSQNEDRYDNRRNRENNYPEEDYYERDRRDSHYNDKRDMDSYKERNMNRNRDYNDEDREFDRRGRSERSNRENDYENSRQRERYSPRDRISGGKTAQRLEDYNKTRAEAEFGADLNPNKRDKAVVVSIYSAKGGVGKTTIADNIAVYLALTSFGHRRCRVCIIDYNIDFGDVRATLGFPTGSGPDMCAWALDIRERLDAGEYPEEINYSQIEIDKYLQTLEDCGLYALLAPVSHAESMDIESEELRIMLRNIAENGGFDFVVCDTGNNTRDSSVFALEAADCVLLITNQDIAAATCNYSSLEALERLGFNLSKIKLVINSVMPSKVTGVPIADVEAAFSDFECIARIKNNPEIIAANNTAEPLVYKPNHPVTKDYQPIIGMLTGQTSENIETSKPKKGLFGKKKQK